MYKREILQKLIKFIPLKSQILKYIDFFLNLYNNDKNGNMLTNGEFNFIKEIGLGRSRLSQILKELQKSGLLKWKKVGRRKAYFFDQSMLR